MLIQCISAVGNWGGWKADADAFLRQSQSRGPQVPFRLDVAAGIHRKAQLAVLKRCVKTAFSMLHPAQVLLEWVTACQEQLRLHSIAEGAAAAMAQSA